MPEGQDSRLMLFEGWMIVSSFVSVFPLRVCCLLSLITAGHISSVSLITFV